MFQNDLIPIYLEVISLLFPRSAKKLRQVKVKEIEQSNKTILCFEALTDETNILVNASFLRKTTKSYLQSVLIHEICHIIVGTTKSHNHIFLRRLFKSGLRAKKLKRIDLHKLVMDDVKFMATNRDAMYISDNFVELEMRRVCKKNKYMHPHKLIKIMSKKLGVDEYDFFNVVCVRHFAAVVLKIQNDINMTKPKHMLMTKKDLWNFIRRS